MPPLDVKAITIIGTGLLGGSIGLALKAAGFKGQVLGAGRRQQTLDAAKARGCIDEAFVDWAPAIARSGLVVLATPLGHFPDLLAQLAKLDHPDLVITDVGSTKLQVCQDAARLLPAPRKFVGSHPMAGSEQQGPQHARADLFRGRPCIMVDDPAVASLASPAAERVKSLWQTLGMRLLTMPAAEHDRKVAAVSHLPHALAVLLVEAAIRSQAIDVTSTGFGDTTRIAGGDPQVWLDIFSTNRPAMLEAIDGFQLQLSQFRQMLATMNEQDLKALLERAQTHREKWGRQQT
ncbi:MAG: prephenate dehydrogenase/arogenate dehydrogenase family protein [Phycisphaeraceae bacterium]|nr:prephenate dehydrogenase/arogenate dehydrogenase family protein [Phycisphaeraceae bacterium]